MAPLAELATALRQDVEWIREHTRLTEAALRWDARGRAGADADDLLLRGADLADGLAWAARRKEDAPEITALQRSYLTASESYATALAAAERERLEGVRRFQRRIFGVLGLFAAVVVAGTGAGLWLVFTSWQKQMIDRSHFGMKWSTKRLKKPPMSTRC